MKTNINRTLWTGVLVVSICSALTSTAAAQGFAQVPGFLSKIAVGSHTVAGINDSGQIVTYDTSSSNFQPIPGGSGQFVALAVGGGTVLQPDEVWGLDENRQIFRLSNGSFQQIPGQLAQIAVGPGFETCHPAEVWGLNETGGIFRFDFCSGQFHQAPGQLIQISVGEHEVWGLNATGAIFHWNFNTFVFENVPGVLSQISAGPAGAVWGVNQEGKVFRLSRNKESAKFLEIAIAGPLEVISVGGNGVWGLDGKQGILHFDEGAQQFVGVTGLLDSIAVGSSGGIWGLSGNQGIFVFKP
jgi:hypothetical protein